jgi:hypothetical protein
VVRNAATQAVEEAGQPNPYVPRPLAPAHDAAWLIAFAGKQGQGIVPGQPVDALLLDALECGSPEEKLAAMTYLRHAPAPSRDLIGALYKLAFSPGGTLRETAAGTLWLMALGGAELPNPAEFRLG